MLDPLLRPFFFLLWSLLSVIVVALLPPSTPRLLIPPELHRNQRNPDQGTRFAPRKRSFQEKLAARLLAGAQAIDAERAVEARRRDTAVSPLPNSSTL